MDGDKNKEEKKLQNMENAVQGQSDISNEWASVVSDSVKEYVGMRKEKTEADKEVALEAIKSDRTKFIAKTIMLVVFVGLLVTLSQLEMLTMEVAIGLGVAIGAMFNLDSISWPKFNSD